ncbi:MAG TPA: tRNA lysidine(34) synthetase TilS [Aquabacterium sp.]|nr:tRNA lysidine(34) synthetase TilS [Aquabacterium sp.]
MRGGRDTVAVAFSGGRDSLALLHAVTRAAALLDLDVVVLHVHHGLVPVADEWVRSAQRLCARWRRRGWPVRLRWERLAGVPAPGDSVEAWARRERYAALARMADEEGATMVLLAQHRRDQAETVLLQAMRGGGPKALAAMPRLAQRRGITWARPWLTQPRSAIDAYIRRYHLRPIEDPSNADPRWARNRLRHEVWPAISAAFPDAEQALAAVAERAAEASAALDELAANDLASVAHEGGLGLAAWLRLSASRRALVLRAWLALQLAAGVPESLVQRLMLEWPRATAALWPVDAERQLEAYRGCLRWVMRGPALRGPGGPLHLDLSIAGDHPVPDWGGRFEVRVTDVAGIEPALLRATELRARSGGEQFQRAPRTPPRSLKKQFQLTGIPASGRQGPLVWSGERLLYVPGLGIDARALAEPGQPQLTLRWVLQRSS